MYNRICLFLRYWRCLKQGKTQIMSKRKRSQSAGPVLQKQRPLTCILHTSTIPDNDPFTLFTSVRGSPTERLQRLQEIRDKRLSQPHDSSNRMQSVCDQIPASLPVDLDKVGYHRKMLPTLHIRSQSCGAASPYFLRHWLTFWNLGTMMKRRARKNKTTRSILTTLLTVKMSFETHQMCFKDGLFHGLDALENVFFYWIVHWVHDVNLSYW